MGEVTSPLELVLEVVLELIECDLGREVSGARILRLSELRDRAEQLQRVLKKMPR